MRSPERPRAASRLGQLLQEMHPSAKVWGHALTEADRGKGGDKGGNTAGAMSASRARARRQREAEWALGQEVLVQIKENLRLCKVMQDVNRQQQQQLLLLQQKVS